MNRREFLIAGTGLAVAAAIPGKGAAGKIGYGGFASPEISHSPEDTAQLKKVSQALDKILSLA